MADNNSNTEGSSLKNKSGSMLTQQILNYQQMFYSDIMKCYFMHSFENISWKNNFGKGQNTKNIGGLQGRFFNFYSTVLA